LKKTLTYAILSGLLLGSLWPSAASGADSATKNGLIADYDGHSLIKTDGTYWVWGGFQKQTVPTQIQGLTDVEKSFDGQYVRKTDGSLWRWEENKKSTTGYDLHKVEEISKPIDVLAFSNEYALILDEEGRVYRGSRLEEDPSRYHYAPLEGISGVAELTYYYKYPTGMIIVFLKKDGSVWRSDISLTSILPSAEIRDAVHIQQEVVLLKDGSVREWSVEYDPDYLQESWKTETAKRVEGLPALKSISSNGKANLGIDSELRLWFWGATVTGFSDGTARHEQSAPVLLTNVKNVKTAYALDRSISVLTQEGKVYEASIEGATMPKDAKFTLLAANAVGLSHSIIQKNDGTLWVWGHNKYGSFGTGDDKEFTTDIPLPMQAPIEVALNGESIPLNNGVITRNSQAFVPLRSIFEKLGAKISWDETNKIATLERPATEQNPSVTVQLNFKAGTTALNGSEVKLQNELFNSAGSSYLPLRFISETLGAKVDWQQKAGKIFIAMS
jgi:Alpha-tubulin suppressor and related RCC1 domain-containing proteins